MHLPIPRLATDDEPLLRCPTAKTMARPASVKCQNLVSKAGKPVKGFSVHIASVARMFMPP